MAERDYYPSYYDPGYETSGAGTSGGLDFAAFGRGAMGVGRDVATWVGQAARDAGPATISSGAGTLLNVVGGLMAAKAAKKAAAYNSAVLERNAQAAAQAAENEAYQHQRNAAILLNDVAVSRQSQAEQERTQRQQQAYVVSQTRAIMGASGVMMRGSPLVVMEHTLRQSERQILAGRYVAELRERALRDQATMEGYAAETAHFGAGERLRVGGAQGALARYTGQQQARAAQTGAFGDLLSGSARTYAAYERGQYIKRGGSLRESLS